MDLPVRGLWLLPTRRRIDKLRIFFEKAVENGLSTPGVVLVQDAELAELLSEYNSITLPRNWSIASTRGEGIADKGREIWPAIKNLDWVGWGCDDLRPQTLGWDRTLLERVSGRNIVTCNDGVQGASRMSGITIFSGGVLRAMGYLFPPLFWHTYVDNVWEDIGRQAGCWTYVAEVLVTHDHPFRNQQIDPALADETTYKSYGQQPRDLSAYAAWKAQEQAGVIERVKALRGD